jgi:glucose/arabinose dehydrogenase
VLRIRHQPETTHNADQLQFLGRHLYISTGDGGGIGDPGDDAKSTGSLLGKILRIDPRNAPGRARYRVPRSNPYVGRRGRDLIFARGLRNPWRFSFDRVTAPRPRIVIADVGQQRFEEVNYETLSNARGAFFGWDEYEGRRPFECGRRCARHHEPPVYTYGRRRGCTIIGGYVVRDRSLGRLYGRYVFADFCEGRIRTLRPRLRRIGRSRRTRLRVVNPVSFGEDRRGRLYVITHGGRVFRIVMRR